MNRSDDYIVGTAPYHYRPVPDWPKLPDNWELIDVVGVATDSQDRVFVFSRSPHPLIVFDSGGNIQRWWGEDMFVRPHGLHIAADDTLYLTDDDGHAVYHCTADGDLLRTFGTPGQASDTGIEGADFRTIQQAGPPFNRPTNVAIDDRGRLFVTDGYCNARVHRFSPEGELELSWGAPGNGPSEFNVPHAVAIDPRGRLLVADRENSRIQVFTPDGKLLTVWTNVARPNHMHIDPSGHVFMAETGWHAGLYPWTAPQPDKTGGRVSIFNLDGKLISQWGGGHEPCAPHDFFAPHTIWVDSRGDVYVGEVTWSAGGNEGMVPRDCPPLKKFKRL